MRVVFFIKYSLVIMLVFSGEIGKCVQKNPFFNVEIFGVIGDSMVSYNGMNKLFSVNPYILKNIYPGMKGLIKRSVPAWTDKFIIDSIAKENDKDVFEIESENNKIVLRGSYITACYYAFNGDLVRNALDLITLWGDKSKDSLTHDYSYREWTGMMDGYYLPRW